MPKVKATAVQQRNRTSQAIIDYSMTKEALSFEQVGKHIHRDKRTVQKKRQDPETFTLGDIRGMAQLFHWTKEDLCKFVGME